MEKSKALGDKKKERVDRDTVRLRERERLGR